MASLRSPVGAPTLVSFPSRRALVRAGAAVVLAPGTSRAASQSAASTPSRPIATGYLGRRIALTTQRLLHGREPAFTDDMVLADVTGDQRRRFYEWSGDLSGRFLEALAHMPGPEAAARGARLMTALVASQRHDGRFGDGALSFTSEAIDRPHMSLLWGNGRLLVGLLEHHAARGDEASLASARRLGEFLVQVSPACLAPAVRARVAGAAAQGFICFTQIAEGLARLGSRTRDERFVKAAAQAAATLEPRGKQHTHGYLATLRGGFDVHEAGGGGLAEVRRRIDELVASPDFLVTGGVAEYFGGGAQHLGRDEGCSEADVLRLFLQAWRMGGRIDDLERAERCLHNAFFFNQWENGDFGSHVLSLRGSRPDDGAGRAWWCCTMHGARAFTDVLGAAVTSRGERQAVNLYLPGRYAAAGATVTIDERPPTPDGRWRYQVSCGRGTALAFRRPAWARQVTLRAGGKDLEVAEDQGYLVPAVRAPAYEVLITPRLGFVRRQGDGQGAMGEAREVLGDKPTDAAAFLGPWLLGVDDELSPRFLGEPWHGNVVAALGAEVFEAGATAGKSARYTVPGTWLRVPYQHSGYDQPGTTVLRPIAEQTGRALRGTLAFWLRYQRQSGGKGPA
jgi:hypothetical protein